MTDRHEGPPIPVELRDEFATWTWDAMSIHEGRSATWRLTNDVGASLFLKIVRQGVHPNVADEAERTLWARAYLPVPEVLRTGTTPGASWLLARGIQGVNATHPSFSSNVEALVDRLAEGLRRFHSAPVDACPFQFRLDDAIRHVRRRQAAKKIDPGRDFHPEFSSLDVENAVDELIRTRPMSEDLVVCHGDYCAPNILLHEKSVVGYVDLGELGVADRWWDLAVATWSVTWNFGPGHESRFLDAYGATPDEARMRYYRLLYDLVS